MRLAVRTWGTGSRTALLVHGYSDDAGTWWRVGPALAERGFTVIGPDLRGHGASPRAASYTIEDFAQDLCDTLPTGADLVVGHSLGAVALGFAAPELRPRRAVFVDPSWFRSRSELALATSLPTTAAELPPQTACWSPEDVAADLASNRLLDPAVTTGLLAALAVHDLVPAPRAVGPGALVVVPELDPVLPVTAHAAVRALGYEIRTVPAVRHVMHRDDLAAFLAVLPVDDGVLA